MNKETRGFRYKLLSRVSQIIMMDASRAKNGGRECLKHTGIFNK